MNPEHSDPTPVDRRDFLRTTGTLAMAGSAALAHQGWAEENTEPAHEICVFTKPFNSLSFDALAEHVAAMGFDGIEAPIRPGGHIEPEDVAEELPKLHAALQKAGLNLTVMASNVNSASDPVSRRILETAAGLGIPRFRMQYFRYDRQKDVLGQVDHWRKEVAALANLCEKTGIQAVYQNHAGDRYMGSSLWDLQRVIAEVDPQQVGVAYDIRHAVAEAGMSWQTTWQMIQPHVAMVYVKDFRWDGKQVVNVPLGTGNVPKLFFDLLQKSKFSGPLSLHEEYLDHRDPKLVPQHLAAMKTDFTTLKDWLGTAPK